MVDTRAKFHIASTHGDWIGIESRIESFKRSSFEVTHKLFKGEALAIEAFEPRVLVGRHPDAPARLKSAPVPVEIIARFMRGCPRQNTRPKAAHGLKKGLNYQ